MKVSVSLVTYQQADCVRQSAASALDQKTGFPFEVIIGDDGSTDATPVTLEEIRADNPGSVKLILAESNRGDAGMANVKRTVAAASGEYVAFLDGDDYWTAPDKLQRQADFLDAHPECAICAHRVEHLAPSGERHLSPSPGPGDGSYDVALLLRNNFTPKISTMIRKSAIDAMPEWYWTSGALSADWVMNVLACQAGRVGFLDEAMAVHRLHDASVSAAYGSDRMLADKIRMLRRMRPLFPERDAAFAKAAQRIRLKRGVLRLSPFGYETLRRVAAARRRVAAS
ncbi:MAG: glycosyltransferase [Silicimonas sp.]|nr:glycosyltransferase [Silicimonas sp.]